MYKIGFGRGFVTESTTLCPFSLVAFFHVCCMQWLAPRLPSTWLAWTLRVLRRVVGRARVPEGERARARPSEVGASGARPRPRPEGAPVVALPFQQRGRRRTARQRRRALQVWSVAFVGEGGGCARGVLWRSLGLGVCHVLVPACCINTLLCTPSFAISQSRMTCLCSCASFVLALVLLAQICSRPACGRTCVACARSPAGGRAVHGCAPPEGTPASHGGPGEGSPCPHQGSRAESRHGRKLALSLLRCGELGLCTDV